jgi:cell wall-associated NlpC family hydrolase
MSNDLASRQHAATPGHGASRIHHGDTAPGKRPLVEQVQMPAIQMHGAGEQSDEAVHAAAAQGVATPASSLPYGDHIQRAFGRHDISSVKAHTGADAARSAKAMGADAYAAGDHVVLGSKSDLHTAAHEAAHVVQQRGGVQLKGGIGQAGDSYERHADAVADKVVAGDSAEALLSEMAGPAGGAGGVQKQAVQRTGAAHDGEAAAHGEHEASEHEAGEDHEAAHDQEAGEQAAKPTAAAPEGADDEAPIQKKASADARGREIGAVQMKRSAVQMKAGGYRAAPSLAAVRAGSASIRRGMSGSSVKFVQQHVGAAADGLFGPHTLAAVKAFQRSHHLEVDGIVGPRTMGAIDHGGSASAGGSGKGSKSGGASHDTGGHASGSEAAIRDQVIDKARSHMGARYSWAAEGPSMFDCSGFAWYVLHTDMHLTSAGRTTAAGLSHTPYTTHTGHPEKGDLVFYSSGGISHVTIALGGGSQVIGASGGGSHTHGNDPNARVKITDWTHDSRSKSFGSIQGLIDHKLGK